MKRFLLTLCACACSPMLVMAADWQPAKGPLMTRWAKEVSPEKVLPEYPRPQMVREKWTNLNGLWQFAVVAKDAAQPTKWDGQILVPFPIESALSGVMKPVSEKEKLWYRRTFKNPETPKDGRVLLHFGAVDWQAIVYVNGKDVGKHTGGYTPFSFDITDALKEDGEQELVVAVWDPTDASFQPRGKQIRKPESIWYTAVTGIWQTVWLEPVPKIYLKHFTMTPVFVDGKPKHVAVRGVVAGRNGTIDFSRPIKNAFIGFADSWNDVADNGEYEFTGTINFEGADVWSPETPVLHPIAIQTKDADGKVLETIKSYTALRTIELKKDEAGHNRLFLNNKPVFQYGPLDQGWWPDGLYTAPTDAALAYDVEMTKKFGMNMCRKHVKVEPARWYYHCDRLGLLVWQDMPNGDRHIGPGAPDIMRSAESEANYRKEWKEIMDFAGQFGCVVAWVPFNEGWGQFKTNEILEWTKKYDGTRLVDGPSGWTDRLGGDMHDMHMYPGPGMFPTSEKRASVLGEFGGLGLPMENHLWWNKRNWGYRTYKTQAELQSHYEDLIKKLIPLVPKGLAAAIYTQTTDVEGEVNGLMTYDREVIKLDIVRVAELHKRLYDAKPAIVRELIATSAKAGQMWAYTTTKPADGWQKPGFDEAGWREGPGGFGTKGTPGAVVRTTWDTPEIWLRRTFDYKPAKGTPELTLHHDEDAEIFINGVSAATMSGYTSEYVTASISPEAAATLKPGKNTIAVRCRQTRGGQYIDVGLVDVVPVEAKTAAPKQ